jgi:nitroreductase
MDEGGLVMETLECIRTRRSIRRYKSDPLSEEVLEKVLEAVRWAPSWANTQCREMVVVRDESVKKALQDTLPQGNPAWDAIVQAPVVIAACARMGRAGVKKNLQMTVYGDWAMFDMGIACQNLCLAAHDLGLGTVHVGLLDHRKAGKVLGLPEDVQVFELIPLGIPDQEAEAPPRRPLKEFVHHDKF